MKPKLTLRLQGFNMPSFDIKITGGDLIDGTGAAVRRADVGVKGDRIEDVGDLSGAGARVEIRADGKCVVPGFVDAHSHSDAYLLIEPASPSKIFQGITTEIVGHCGASAAPRVGRYRMPADWREKEYPGSWSSVAEYRGLLEQVRPAPNVAMLVGHNAIRAGVMGYEARHATEEEILAMLALLEQGLCEGARGLSTGLIYPPGKDAAREEIWRLAQVVVQHDGTYTTHMRSEGRGLLAALDETIEVARRSGVRVQVAHLKTAGRENWPLCEPVLARIEGARQTGLSVAADRYPYTASCTDLDIVLPDWAAEGGPDALLARLRDPGTRRRMRDELSAARDADYWVCVTVGSTASPENRRFSGKPLLEVAEDLGVEPAEAVLHLIDSDNLQTGGIFFGMSEDNMWTILGRPYVMLGTDASLRSPEGPLSHDHPHPRAYGTFPRFLRAALDGKIPDLPEAIRKMTSLPAQQFGLRGRGVLAEACKADIVVFDPATLRDTATYANPHQLAVGIDTVIVNGVLTVQDGKLTGKRGGRFLG